MSDQTTAPALTEHKGMRMARATEKDMEVGYELMALLDDMDRGYYPARPGDKSEGGPTHFDSDNHEHLEYLFQRIYEIADKSGSFGRIMGGMSVFLNPKNDIVDFNDHCIALSPSLKEAIKAKGLWEYYQAFVRTHGAESITELVVQRDKLKAENDRLRAALERVAKWYGEFPDTGRQWDDGEAMSFTACFGSDGAREHMRDVARLALLPVETPDHG